MQGTYKSLFQFRQFNYQQGYHWFDASSMKFFGTRLHADLYGGCVFVTSDKNYKGDRMYSVRVGMDNGSVHSYAFVEYDTRSLEPTSLHHPSNGQPMTTPMLPPIGSAYFETLKPHVIVVVVSHNASASKYGQLTYKRMDTGTEVVCDAPIFTYHYSPLEEWRP